MDYEKNSLYPLIGFTYTFLIVFLSLVLLVKGQSMLVPLVIAIVIWYLIITLSYSVQNIPVIGKYLPYPIAFIIALLLCGVVFWGIVALIRTNITAIVASAPIYQDKLEAISKQILDYLGVDRPPKLSATFREFNFNQLAANLAQTATDIASSTGIIIIYVIFLLLEHHSFDQKLSALMQNTQKLEKARSLIRKISTLVQSYIKIKILTSLLTAVCAYAVLVSVGVDFADFWALMIFLLNFIPTIGAIIATIFPCILTLIQFDSITPFLIVAFSLSAVQFFVGNILEPRLMGKSFNLSALVIILSLALWGQIWGIAGMFLCVPIMVIANIILANFPQTRSLAILLSENGEIRQ